MGEPSMLNAWNPEQSGCQNQGTETSKYLEKEKPISQYDFLSSGERKGKSPNPDLGRGVVG